MNKLAIICSTRDGRSALVACLRELVAGEWSLVGRIDGRDLEMWRSDGTWRDDRSEHPNDLLIEPALKKILTH